MLIKSRLRLGVSPLSWPNNVLVELGGDTPLEQYLSDAVHAGCKNIEPGRELPVARVVKYDVNASWLLVEAAQGPGKARPMEALSQNNRFAGALISPVKNNQRSDDS